MTKAEEVRQFIEAHVMTSLAESITEMTGREHAEAIRLNRRYLASRIAWHFNSQYVYLELSDIMEWKRQRVRR